MVGIPKRNANHLFLEAENPATRGGEADDRPAPPLDHRFLEDIKEFL